MRGVAMALCATLGLCLSLGCDSTPVGAEADGANGGTSQGGSDAGSSSRCTAALKQSLSLVDAVSESEVVALETSPELLLYVDASAGGLSGTDQFPWVYVSLVRGEAVALTDLEALSSRAWDLALKRFVLRTNGGDSGPGAGGALRLTLPWESVEKATLGERALPTEQWLDEDCNLTTGETQELLTTFSGWYQYDAGSHRLTPLEATYLVRGGDGALYKLAVLDYYANADGSHGTRDGHFKLRIAALP